MRITKMMYCSFVVLFVISIHTKSISQVTQGWVKTFNGSGWMDAHLYGYAMDASGNIYVTGSTMPTSGNFEDVITIKYNSSGVEQWRKTFDGGYGVDYGTAIALDPHGDVYVAAFSRGASNSDYLIIKYSASGTQLWTSRYNGPGNSYDQPTAILVDRNGYVWVTGTTGSTPDITTIVADSTNGSIAATDTYVPPDNIIDYPVAMKMDRDGYVVVTGVSTSDYVTIKYDSYGVEQWSKRFDWNGNLDNAKAMETDKNGNIYVTGFITTGGSNSDFFTIKYNANGDTLWTRRENIGNTGDVPTAMAIDSSGNIIVAGYTTDNSNGYFNTCLIKYAPSGSMLWTRQYGAGDVQHQDAEGVGVDTSGNIYVIGRQYGAASKSILLLKYTSAGTLIDSSLYSTTDHYENEVTGIAVTPAGLSFCFATTASQSNTTTHQFLIQKYDSSCLQLWTTVYTSPDNASDAATAMAIDKNGNIYVTGTAFFALSGYENIMTTKILPSGDTAWVRYYNYSGISTDIGRAITIDQAGNVYVTGESYGSTNDFITIKYDSSGNKMWANRYDGGSTDGGKAVGVDGSGNVIVTGASMSSGTYDIVTVRYNASGGGAGFPQRYNPSGGIGSDEPFGIVLDASGNSYVVGTCTPSASSSTTDLVVIKYSTTLTKLWERTYTSPGPTYDSDGGQSICRDSVGDIYVAGYLANAITHDRDIVVIKLNSNGDSLWSVRYDGSDHQSDTPLKIVYGGKDRVVVTGQSGNGDPNYDSDILTMCVDTAGTILWSRRYHRSGIIDLEKGVSVAIDTAGNSYVIGTTSGFSSNNDFIVLRYDKNGALVWNTLYNGTANSHDFGSDIVVDVAGHVYVAGSSKQTETSDDFAVVRFNQSVPLPVELTSFLANINGNAVELLWRTATETNNYGFEIERKTIDSRQLKIGDWEKVGFVEGSGTSNVPKDYSYTDKNVSTGKYSYRLKQIDRDGKFSYSQSIEVTIGVAPKEFTLAQNYPNPFNPTTVISYQLPVISKVTLKIYDVLGREVATLVNEEQTAGWKEVKWNAKDVSSGIYFYRLHAGSFVETEKMLVVK